LLFEREDLFAVFDLEREFDFAEADFDDDPRFEPLLLDREPELFLVAILFPSRR
jgi:hypothetical protein